MLVIISFLIAVPLSWYFMPWLVRQNYNYRVELSWWIFFCRGWRRRIICHICYGKCSGHQAAVASPVKSLRTE